MWKLWKSRILTKEQILCLSFRPALFLFPFPSYPVPLTFISLLFSLSFYRFPLTLFSPLLFLEIWGPGGTAPRGPEWVLWKFFWNLICDFLAIWCNLVRNLRQSDVHFRLNLCVKSSSSLRRGMAAPKYVTELKTILKDSINILLLFFGLFLSSWPWTDRNFIYIF